MHIFIYYWPDAWCLYSPCIVIVSIIYKRGKKYIFVWLSYNLCKFNFFCWYDRILVSSGARECQNVRNFSFLVRYPMMGMKFCRQAFQFESCIFFLFLTNFDVSFFTRRRLSLFMLNKTFLVVFNGTYP